MSSNAVDRIFAPKPVDPDAVHRDGRGKIRKPSKKVRDAIKAMQSGAAKTITDAAEQVGLSRPHLSEMLRQPHVQAYVHSQVQGSLTVALLRSGDRARDLVDASSEHVSLDAVKHVQGLAGLRATDPRGPLVNINIAPGYVIDMRDPRTGQFDGQPLPEMSTEDRRAMLLERGLLTDTIDVTPKPAPPSIETDRPAEGPIEQWEASRRALAPRKDVKPVGGIRG